MARRMVLREGDMVDLEKISRCGSVFLRREKKFGRRESAG